MRYLQAENTPTSVNFSKGLAYGRIHERVREDTACGAGKYSTSLRCFRLGMVRKLRSANMEEQIFAPSPVSGNEDRCSTTQTTWAWGFLKAGPHQGCYKEKSLTQPHLSQSDMVVHLPLIAIKMLAGTNGSFTGLESLNRQNFQLQGQNLG